MTEPRTDPEGELVELVASLYDNPLGFVQFAFEWGQGELQGFHGPDQWAAGYLREYGQEIANRGFDGSHPVQPIRFSTSSGHGIGKSALVAWIILFIMSTRPQCKGVVTAMTSPQLETKTWVELAKWHRRCITGHWFDITTSRGNMKIVNKDHPETWRCDAQTSREENSESFAGLHAADSTPFYIFDEASGVPDEIWSVAEGGLTDGEPHFHAFGNPTRSSGRFHQNTFGRQRHRWITREIDSRSVAITNKELIQTWIDDYGVDSDFVRVRVLGKPPRQSSMQFIGSDVADMGQTAQVFHDQGAALTMGIDVARFGDDQSVISFKRGSDARSIEWIKVRGLDTMQLSGLAIEKIEQYKPDHVFIDGVGVGGGVVDYIRKAGYLVTEVNAGGRPQDEKRYKNRRAEMWDRMKTWLQQGGCIPADDELHQDLVGVEYGYDLQQRLQLERKEDMKRRGLASPDCADSLSLHFLYAVARADMKQSYSATQPIQAVPEFRLYD